ncbi:MAG: malto-oligosyltrehalose trehalohydrolase [Microbacteriaceae bacterium]
MGHPPFEVWAPRARAMTLLADGVRYPMHQSTAGHWQLNDAPAGELKCRARDHDIDYGYLIDDDATPLPDPRSRRQPDGVHALSRTFNPAKHSWGDAAWTGRSVTGCVIYELHIGTFTPEGTLHAALGRLDHLVELGVDFVELLPVNAFNGTHNWGYDGVLWYAVHELYGGPRGYQEFVDACHQRSLGVIQDVVYNHLGPSGNYLPRFGPYLGSDANTWGASVNLDGPGSDQVRRYILDNARMWLADYHVDGLRLDAVHALVDRRATTLLEELAAETDTLSVQLRRPLSLIAESDLNDPRLITSRQAGGIGLSAQWSDDFHHAMHANLTGDTTGYYADFAGLDALAKVLTRGFFHDGTYSSFRGRHHGRPIDTMRTATSRLVVFDQDHDQIGNRAEGDRLSACLDSGQLTIAAAFTILSPFTPMLFMGEEWAASTPWQFFTSHPEPDLAEATAAGRLTEFARMGWDPQRVPDPQDPESFTRSILDWSEREQPHHAQMLAVYRTLCRIRRNYPDLTAPRFALSSVQYDNAAGWLVLRRGAIVIAANFAAVQATLPLGPLASTLLAVGTVQATSDAAYRLGGHACLVGIAALA